MFGWRKGILGGALLSMAILWGANVAHAQPSTQPQGGMMGQGMMGPMGMMHGPMLEGRLAYIKAELAITDAQSTAWNAYADAVRFRASGMQTMHETMAKAMESGTAAARMDAHINAMEGMTEALKGLKPATEALYAVLTPDQKQKADQLLGMGCMM